MKPEFYAILLLVIEMLLRVSPTTKNYSIIDFLHRVLAFLIPNKTKAGSEWKLKNDDQEDLSGPGPGTISIV